MCLCDCVTCVRANTVYIVELIHLLLLFTCVTENTSHVLLIHYSPRVRHISIITVTHSGLDRRHPLLPQHLNGEKNRAEPPNLPGRWLAGWLAGWTELFISFHKQCTQCTHTASTCLPYWSQVSLWLLADYCFPGESFVD